MVGSRSQVRGDSNSIWIEKGNHKVVFDIKIKTPKGELFAVYFKRQSAKGNKWQH